MSTNLSIQLTSFVGREQQLEELSQLLADVRLLTLVGAGGIGKTRLALKLADRLQDTFPDGVWAVELAALQAPELVGQSIAATLGALQRPGETVIQSLQQTLRGRKLLLVLDNCEHLISACAELVEDLLRVCPRLTVLVTSREALAIAGETTWRVPSLSLPPHESAAAADEIGACEAARLFVERARSILPGFAITERNAPAIAQICWRLDGIPLAVELAAARVGALGVEQILARLQDRFQFLVDRHSRSVDRHRTLRATVEWSHDLLSEPERLLFRRLSVFAGGWTLEAAEAVCADDRLPSAHVLDLLASLVNRSLVLAEGQETTARYRLLETLREFGAERLQAAEETKLVRDRHADWYLTLAQHGEAELHGPGQARSVAVMETEHDNVRAALRWSLDGGVVDRAFALATAYAYFWEIRGHRYRSEARQWLDEALGAASAGVDLALRARALYWSGTFAAEQFEFERAEFLLQQDVTLCQQLRDTRGLAEALLGVGQIALLRGEFARAEEDLTHSLKLARERGDQPATASALRTLGTLARVQGGAVPALEHYTSSLHISESLRDEHQSGHVLDHIGECERDRARLDVAAAAHRRAVQLLEKVGCEEGVNSSRYRQACLARAQGDSIRALTLALESLRGYRLLGNARDVPAALEFLAELLTERQPLAAVRLFGLAEAQRQSLGLAMPPIDRSAYSTALAQARARLDTRAFDVAWSAGRALTIDQAIEMVARAQSSMASASNAPSTSPLTPREREVAVLIARGYANKEIAEALVVSVRTAEAHVTNVLNKVGLRSRAQIAAWVVEQGLLVSTDHPPR